MKSSTSIHQLNADNGLNWPLNNTFPLSNLDPHLNLQKMSLKLPRNLYAKLGERSTPTRQYSNLFWLTYPWRELKKELGSLHLFDIGCGFGGLTARITDRYAPGLIDSYLGVDVLSYQEQWASLHQANPFIKFQQIHEKTNLLDTIPPQTNLIISQSSLEHIEDDLLVFRQIKQFIANHPQPIIQIHLVPAASSLWLYLLHGVRQYTPKNLSKITRLFSPKSTCHLVRFGGSSSFWLQAWYFTAAEVLARFKPKFLNHPSISSSPLSRFNKSKRLSLRLRPYHQIQFHQVSYINETGHKKSRQSLLR